MGLNSGACVNRSEDLVKLDQVIKDAEKRIKTIQANIDALNKELNTLATFEKTLEENIRCLKKNQIIAIAQEFKKTKEELKKTRSRVIMLTNDKEHYIRSSKEVHSLIKKTKEDIQRMEKIGDSNVLPFKSRRKK